MSKIAQLDVPKLRHLSGMALVLKPLDAADDCAGTDPDREHQRPGLTVCHLCVNYFTRDARPGFKLR